eukprot:TRINITY_DN27765_c0_g1_i2.p1 TRINITY_DN27765_c0_g1~~TRINITY_DN27765_c0_g1_i2.p1  ORF type:complete len:685 (-),score=91.27 TRINITY_DN27765_c0_g1_i2:88-2142(-)
MRKAWHADYPESTSVRPDALQKPERASRRRSYDFLPEQESRPRGFEPPHGQESRPRSYEPKRSSHSQNEQTVMDDAPAVISHRQRRVIDVHAVHSNVHRVEENQWSERARHGRDSWPDNDSLQNRPDMQLSRQPIDTSETPRGARKSGICTREHESQEAWDQSDESVKPRSTAASTSAVIGRRQRPIPPSLVVVIVDRLARKAGLDAASALADLQDVIPAALHRELAAVFGQGPFVAEHQGSELSGGVPPALVVVVVDRLTRTSGLDQASAVAELQDVIPDFLYSELLAVFGQNSGAHQQLAQRRPSARTSSVKRPRGGKTSESACQQIGEATSCLNGDSANAHDRHHQHVPDSKAASCDTAVQDEFGEMPQPKNQGKHVSRDRPRSKSPGKSKKVIFSGLDCEKAPDHGTSRVEPNSQCKLPEWAAAARAKFSSQEIAQAAAFGQMLLASFFARYAESHVVDEHATKQRERTHGFSEPEPELLPDTGKSRPAEEGSPEADELLQNSCLVKVAPVTPRRAAAKTRSRSKGKTGSVAGTTCADAELPKKPLTPVDHQARDPKRSHSQDPRTTTQNKTDNGGRNDEANHSPSQLAEWVRTLPPSHLPDKVREELATSLQLQAVDGKRFTDIAENPNELAKFGVLAPLHAMKVRKAWAQVLREDACRRVAAENFGADSDRKSVKVVV